MKWSIFLAPLFVLCSPTFSSTLGHYAALHPSVNSNAVPLSLTDGGTCPRLTNVPCAILVAYTVFDGATHILTVTRSTDGGKTYSAWGTVATGTGDLDNPNLIQLANGNIICTFRNRDLNSTSAYTYYRITATVSKGGGATWSHISQVDERAAGGVNGLWAS